MTVQNNSFGINVTNLKNVKRYKLCSTPLAPNQATVSKMQNTELMYFEWFILSVITYFYFQHRFYKV